jgi:hypothetical protein
LFFARLILHPVCTVEIVTQYQLWGGVSM